MVKVAKSLSNISPSSFAVSNHLGFVAEEYFPGGGEYGDGRDLYGAAANGGTYRQIDDEGELWGVFNGSVNTYVGKELLRGLIKAREKKPINIHRPPFITKVIRRRPVVKLEAPKPEPIPEPAPEPRFVPTATAKKCCLTISTMPIDDIVRECLRPDGTKRVPERLTIQLTSKIFKEAVVARFEIKNGGAWGTIILVPRNGAHPAALNPVLNGHFRGLPRYKYGADIYEPLREEIWRGLGKQLLA